MKRISITKKIWNDLDFLSLISMRTNRVKVYMIGDRVHIYYE